MKRKRNFDFRLFPDEKRGWIRVVEAFVAILLIAGVLLIIFGRGYVGNNDVSSEVYEIQTGILRDIQNNNSLRSDILKPALILPISSDNILFPSQVDAKVQNEKPNSLTCEEKICAIDEVCLLEKEVVKNVYAKSIIVTGATTTRELKLFCWEKD